MALQIRSIPTYQDTGSGIVIGSSIVGFVTTVIVGLRFWARSLTRQPLRTDDWLCLSALFFQHALLVAACVEAIYGGLGRNMALIAPNSLVTFYKALFVSEIAYTYSSPLIKLSVLAFYRRIFPTRTVRLGSFIIGAACIAWCISITILDFTQCRPLRAAWDIELQALPTTKCISAVTVFLSNSIANSVIDFCTLTLPINEVLKLQMSARQKIHISIIFLLGSLALAASLVRTVSTASTLHGGVANFSKQFAISGVATIVEIYAAIIGACLPTVMPVYRQLRYGDPMVSTPTAVSKLRSTGTSSTGHGNRAGQWSHLHSPGGSFERLAKAGDTSAPTTYQERHRGGISHGRKTSDGDLSNTGSYPLETMVKQDTV
ncbi:hypothetical protein F5Y16DRAFT_393058 [Xylariaceae sp. FL0255]|nr:hypothetical protein F5Y16DRAFT_393058 [Xylariaceae sp. FL0255]